MKKKMLGMASDCQASIIYTISQKIISMYYT